MPLAAPSRRGASNFLDLQALGLVYQPLVTFTLLRSELALSYLFISPDMAVIRQLSDRIGGMHQGRFTERGLVKALS